MGAQQACLVCPEGSHCPRPDRLPVACAVGYFSLRGAGANCTRCPAGNSCLDPAARPVLCVEGEWSPEGAANCTACQPGYMCAPGSSQPTPAAFKCKKGGFCAKASDFKDCPAGTYGE